MKTKLWMVFLIGLASCYPDRQIHNLLKDEFQRGKVYRLILRNQMYTDQLLDSIKNLNKVNELLLYASRDKGGMHEQVNQILKEGYEDSVRCRAMCDSILTSENSKAILMELIIEKGYIEKGCLKTPVKKK